ncbi:MAG: hypothetical protein ACTSV7_06985 [Candidatus Baldrarchaeia archaeon]
MEDKKRLYLEANIEVHRETDALRKAVASIIELPKEKDKQPDLLYFSAIFVSSGENLNHAFFLPSELVAAEGTIKNKALDVEHKEDEVVGHLYDRVFTDKSGNPLDLQELASKDEDYLNKTEVHVAVAGIVYKSRFPHLAEEVSEGKWKVSMEAYFNDFDVKIGDLILSKKEAEALGLAAHKGKYFGRMTKVIKKGKEIAGGVITRVLRGIVFSGCGLVKHPANPPSVILETANEAEDAKSKSKEIIILDYDKLEDVDNNNVTSDNIGEDVDDPEEEDENMEKESKDKAELEHQDTVGICVSYKKQVIDSTFKGPGTQVLATDWCALYERGCTSFSRDTTDPDCLRNKVRTIATACVKKHVKRWEKKDKRSKLTGKLEKVLEGVKK